MEKAYYITYLTDLSKDFSSIGRLYVGDAYCDKNFLSELEDGAVIDFLKSSQKDITLVTPMASELLFEEIVGKIEYFILNFDSEIVVNDYWILEYLIERGHQKIIWWTMMSWQDKDPSLAIFENSNLHSRLAIDNNCYKKYFMEIGITQIEIFNVQQWVGITNLNEIKINLNYPNIIFSATRYCPAKIIKDSWGIPHIPESCEWCRKTVSCAGKFDLYMIDKKNQHDRRLDNHYYWNRQIYKNETLPENLKISRLIFNHDLLPNGL
ncbi:MAG: hypothetical protein ACD_2C00258G0009 [uncultured bacterium (gcode 4)]|uniref:Uncharacterized protein n=1 Tax=uncultured bacterium (gcode 4) TaxID=1234023 RepID=K2GF82_9BACT|nr:MAG: hypothetical protein ACD_2C00258G0009 [uncultured bacterium (gcode 4)]